MSIVDSASEVYHAQRGLAALDAQEAFLDYWRSHGLPMDQGQAYGSLFRTCLLDMRSQIQDLYVAAALRTWDEQNPNPLDEC